MQQHYLFPNLNMMIFMLQKCFADKFYIDLLCTWVVSIARHRIQVISVFSYNFNEKIHQYIGLESGDTK